MYSRRKFLHGAGAATLGISLSGIVRATPVFTQRTVGSYPRAFRDENGTWTGFEIELSQHLCSQVGYTLRPLNEYMNWTRSLQSMEAGRLDFLTFVSYREDRTRFLDYIGPYDVEELILVVRKEAENTTMDSLEDLLNTELPIEKTKDASISEEFDRRFREEPAFAAHFLSMTSTGGENIDTMIRKMAARVERKRVSGAITDWYVYRELINQDQPVDVLGYDPGQLGGISLRMLGLPPTYLTVSRHVPQEVRDQLRKAYKDTRENGVFDALWKKWYGERGLPPIS